MDPPPPPAPDNPTAHPERPARQAQRRERQPHAGPPERLFRQALEVAGRPRRVAAGGPPLLDVASALAEILHTPAAAIHRASAYRWASRAVAGYTVCADRAGVDDGLAYLYLGEHYREAALAHAAMGEAWQPLYAEIDAAMAADRARAFNAMRARSVADGR